MEKFMNLDFLKRSDNRLLPLFEGMPPADGGVVYDIVLTPHLYVMRRENLPLKYPFQANRLAPSVLDGLTGDGDYEYASFKDGEEWVFVAYDRNRLLSLMREAGIDPSMVGRLYFAQQFREVMDGRAICLDDFEALADVDGTVTVLPRNFIGEGECVDIAETGFRPQRSFGLGAGVSKGRFLGTKEAVLISGTLILMSILYILEGHRYSSETEKLDRKLTEIAGGDTSLVSGITRKNIHDRYYERDRRQRMIRERVRSIASILDGKSRIESLSLDENGYRSVILVDKGGDISSIVSRASRKGMKGIVKGNRVEIVGRWR
jgi:hypothetical protein